MKRLTPGRRVHVARPDSGRLACRVVATAGQWALLSVDDWTRGLPDWLDGDVYIVFVDGVHQVQLRGRAEPGRRPGELRFAASPGVGHPEPRQAPRVPMNLSATILGPDGDLLEATLMDLAAGGTRVRHYGRLVSGDRARVQFKIPEGPRIDAEAVVKKSESGVSVLVFVGFHNGSAQTVAEWCVDELRRRNVDGPSTHAPGHVAAPAPLGLAA